MIKTTTAPREGEKASDRTEPSVDAGGRMSLVWPGTMLFAVFGAGAAAIAWVLFTPQSKRNDRRWAGPTHTTRAGLCPLGMRSTPLPLPLPLRESRRASLAATGFLASLPNA